jgi:histidinol-phosphate phosphatase family protein
MLIGFQASTKSTAAREIHANVANSVIISRDIEGKTIESLLSKVEEEIKNGKVVILDNTNLTKAVRKPFIDLAKKLNVQIDAQYFKTAIEDCQIRHLRRMYETFGQMYQTGKATEPAHKAHPHCFPPVVFFKARKDLEEPTKSEGFSKIIMRSSPTLTWDETFTNKALFLDIDGTIRKSEHLPNKYPTHPDEVELLYPAPTMRAKLELYRAAGYNLIGVSNQSGISKGILTDDQAEEIFERTRALLGYTRNEFPILYCPHRAAPITCFCRKPQSGMAMDCIMKLKLNPKECMMVGDMKTDEEMAKRLDIPYTDVNDFW